MNISSHPVLPDVTPGYLAKLLPEKAPEEPESFDAIMEDMKTKIVPGLTHWQSPHFYAYYPANTSLAATLGDFFSSGLGCLTFNWVIFEYLVGDGKDCWSVHHGIGNHRVGLVTGHAGATRNVQFQEWHRRWGDSRISE